MRHNASGNIAFCIKRNTLYTLCLSTQSAFDFGGRVCIFGRQLSWCEPIPLFIISDFHKSSANALCNPSLLDVVSRHEADPEPLPGSWCPALAGGMRPSSFCTGNYLLQSGATSRERRPFSPVLLSPAPLSYGLIALQWFPRAERVNPNKQKHSISV